MNWCGSNSKPTPSAGGLLPTRRISTPRSVHLCANYKTTQRKSVPSTKSRPSITQHECALTYVLINRPCQQRGQDAGSQKNPGAESTKTDRHDAIPFFAALENIVVVNDITVH